MSYSVGELGMLWSLWQHIRVRRILIDYCIYTPHISLGLSMASSGRDAAVLSLLRTSASYSYVVWTEYGVCAVVCTCSGPVGRSKVGRRVLLLSVASERVSKWASTEYGVGSTE
jgi:hypothetical protein